MDNIHRRRLNTQILTKTEIALEAIKRYDMEQSRGNVYLSSPLQSGKLLNDLDNDYSKLTHHKVLKLDHNYKISLFTYSQEFYVLQMKNYVFPMRLIIKNVKNEGTIFIGYDQQYPGVYHQAKMAVFEKQPPEKDKNYDHKSVINRDLIIILKNKGNKQISNVYFTIMAGKSFFMCDLKVQFLGFLKDQRVMSQVKINPQHKIITDRSSPLRSQMFPKRTKTNPSSSNDNEFVRSKMAQLQKIEMPIRVQDFSILNNLQLVKHHSKSNATLQQTTTKFKTKRVFYPTQNVRLEGTERKQHKSGHNRDRSELDFKLQEVKRNKQMMETYRIKDKQLRQTASKCKRMIEIYKKAFNEENVRKRKLNKDLVLILYCSKFIKQVFTLTDKRTKKETNLIKVKYLTKRFVQKLKQEYSKTCQLVPYRTKRNINQQTSGIALFSKLLHKHSLAKAQNVLKETFKFLNPLLLVRHSISVSNKYRSKVKVIQKAWKTKYHGRMYCLLYFVDNHVERMLRQFPHFRILQESFYESKNNRAICLQYLKDQSQKYRFIYEAYKRKLQEIEEIITMNKSIALEKSKGRKQLMVPRRPIKPVHRFFRNLDILKSMVRTWFEIEYKKYMKKAKKR